MGVAADRAVICRRSDRARVADVYRPPVDPVRPYLGPPAGERCRPGEAVALPPGQAKKLYRGQRWQNSYGSRYAYGQIPHSLRNRYDLNPNYRYYYGDGYLYRVDPRTLLVQQVISALLR
jgi:hypothetical protein